VFVGHLAVALGARRLAPRAPLVALTSAAFGLDLLWPVFVLSGLEIVRVDPGNTPFTPLDFVSYPWSHSLVMSIVWGVVAGALTSRILRDRRAGIVAAALVVSHWVLDVITHRPDMPIYPGGPRVGLGLWNSATATIVVEAVMLLCGVMIYARTTRARDGIGRWGFWSLIALLVIAFVLSIKTPPPPSITALAVGAIIFGWVFVLFGWWVDRHREALPARIPML
jgi:hypothetical protein